MISYAVLINYNEKRPIGNRREEYVRLKPILGLNIKNWSLLKYLITYFFYITNLNF